MKTMSIILALLAAGTGTAGTTNTTEPVQKVEVQYGIVLDAETGDGKLNNGEEYYNYISYSNVAGIRDGSIVQTISVNNEYGETIYRYDTIVSKEMED